MLATTSVEGSVKATAKCDFCDLHLKTDLDISRHLSSDSHRAKLAQFLSLQNLNTKSIQKEVPKNLVEVLKALRLRSERDVKELADKTFFKIYDDAIAEIALELNKSFFKSLVEFETRSLPPGVRTAFINALEPQEDPPTDTKRTERPSTKHILKQKPKSVQTVQDEELVARQPSKNTKKPAAHPVDSPRLNPRVLPEQHQQPAPMAQDGNLEPQPARRPGQIPRVQRQETNPKPRNPPQQNTNTQTQQPRPHHHQARPNLQERPTPSQVNNSQPPPAATPQAVGKNGTSSTDGQPLPRPHSTYVPKIAVVPRIKTEPKDD